MWDKHSRLLSASWPTVCSMASTYSSSLVNYSNFFFGLRMFLFCLLSATWMWNGNSFQLMWSASLDIFILIVYKIDIKEQKYNNNTIKTSLVLYDGRQMTKIQKTWNISGNLVKLFAYFWDIRTCRWYVLDPSCIYFCTYFCSIHLYVCVFHKPMLLGIRHEVLGLMPGPHTGC